MFYISTVRGDYLGVTDTDDNVEEFYTAEELKAFNIEIIRFNRELPLGYEFETNCFKFILIEGGWKLRYKKGNTEFFNKSSYYGYPVISLYGCFEDYKDEEINIRGMDTSNVTSMREMFSYCESLTTLDVSNFDTSNVTDMSCMFYECKSLTTLGLSHFDTSNVTEMWSMFYCCHSLTSLDVSNFNISNVIYMMDMFYGCDSLILVIGNENIISKTNSRLKLTKFKSGGTYDYRIKVKRGKLNDAIPKLLLTFDKGIVGYEEVD